MVRLRGCLGTLDGGARHLLSLRAGLHGPARSATATARLLHVSARREAMLERRAVVALGRSAATGCAGSPAAVAPALASAGLPALSALSAGAAGAGTGASVSFRTANASRSPSHRGGRSVTIAPSGARTEQAATGASFPGALVTALLALLLAIAMVVVTKLRHRAVPVAGGPVGTSGGLAQTRAAPSPGVASGTDSVPGPQNQRAARPFRPRFTPMDSAIAPMAADAFSRMAHDADPENARRTEDELRTEDESEDRGGTN